MRVLGSILIQKQQGTLMIRIKLQEIAKARGFSQARLSRRADIDLRTIQRIYKDPHTNINMQTLDKLAIALDVDASLLIESEPTGKVRDEQTSK
jgi:transcriptional regulator with XRE-family HTH domain